AQRWARVRDVIDSSLSDVEADQVFDIYLAAYEEAWALFPDVLTCLDGLAGYRLGIITNGQVHQQRLKVQRLGVSNRFECLVISEGFGVAKPSPGIFHRACAEIGERPSR